MMCLSPSLTSSILDIDRVTEKADADALFPLSPELIQHHFGTKKPTQEMPDRWRQRLVSWTHVPLYERNQGIYITIYNDGQPNEIHIEGCSGD